MNVLSAHEFAVAAGIPPRTARHALSSAARGKPWRGHRLPVVQLSGHRGGAGGKVFGLVLDAASPGLRETLGWPQTPAVTPSSTAVNAPVKPSHAAISDDRLQAIRPILELPRNTTERAEAFRLAASQPHRIGGKVIMIAENTLRGMVTGYEQRGALAILPNWRRDKGKRRVGIVRAWDQGIGLPEDVRARIAARLEATAKGLIVKDNTSRREVARLCGIELIRLSAEAGAKFPKARLAALCKLNDKWVKRFERWRVVNSFDKDHKRFSDDHEARVTRDLAPGPLDVLQGDVHHVDMVTGSAREPVRVRIIGWQDQSSGYLWATPVLVDRRQSITQEDVAQSLAEVCFCPWGGMARTYVLDNGSEYKALREGVARLTKLSGMTPGFGVIHAKPYSPESKGRLEGTFRIVEGILSGLPGHIGGDRMNKPTQSKGRPVPPYPHGLGRLLEDIAKAVEIYNGTPQHGMLDGLSPKAMLEHRFSETGTAPKIPSDDMFDLVFSREVLRDVRNGHISLKGQNYYGPVLDDLIGKRGVSVLVPLRDKTGPALILFDSRVHRIAPETHGQTDREGAKAQASRRAGQVAKIDRLRSEADLTVSKFDMQYAAAERGPVAAPPAEVWSMAVIDKTGKLLDPTQGMDPEAAHDAKARVGIDEFLAVVNQTNRGASGSNR